MLVAALPCKRFWVVTMSFCHPERGGFVFGLSFRESGTEGARLVSRRRSSSSYGKRYGQLPAQVYQIMGSTSKRAISIDSTAMKKVCAKNQCATSTTMAKTQN